MNKPQDDFLMPHAPPNESAQRPQTCTAYVALGANLGTPITALCKARAALDGLAQSRVRAASSVYQTAPIDAPGQADYFNAVIALETALPPHVLLAALFDIEACAGRERIGHNAARTLDLDLLLYGALCLNTPCLTVPHPRMHTRAFVLHPLFEIAPTVCIPGHGPVHAHLARVQNQRIERLSVAWPPHHGTQCAPSMARQPFSPWASQTERGNTTGSPEPPIGPGHPVGDTDNERCFL